MNNWDKAMEMLAQNVDRNYEEIKENRKAIEHLSRSVASLQVKAAMWGAMGCAILYGVLRYVLKI